MAALLDTGLSVSDHSYHGRTYKQTFVGSEAVDFLCSRFPELRSEFLLRVGVCVFMCVGVCM